MANNPYVNKVDYNNETLIDLTNDTVTEDTLPLGVTAHDATGRPITGRGVNADTIDGWHFAVRDDGTLPPSGVTNTMTFIYTKGG